MVSREQGGRFAKGVSGNPGGRPKSKLRAILREYIAEDDPHVDRSRAQRLVEEAYRIATDPAEKSRDKLQAIAWIVENCDGRLPTTIVGEGEAGGIVIRFSDAPPPKEPGADG